MSGATKYFRSVLFCRVRTYPASFRLPRSVIAGKVPAVASIQNTRPYATAGNDENFAPSSIVCDKSKQATTSLKLLLTGLIDIKTGSSNIRAHPSDPEAPETPNESAAKVNGELITWDPPVPVAPPDIPTPFDTVKVFQVCDSGQAFPANPFQAIVQLTLVKPPSWMSVIALEVGE